MTPMVLFSVGIAVGWAMAMFLAALWVRGGGRF